MSKLSSKIDASSTTIGRVFTLDQKIEGLDSVVIRGYASHHYSLIVKKGNKTYRTLHYGLYNTKKSFFETYEVPEQVQWVERT